MNIFVTDDLEAMLRALRDGLDGADVVVQDSHDRYDGPGIYAVFAKVKNCFPGINLPSSGVIYIGQSKNLESRNHFTAKQSGFSTLRRSIGAILKERLGLSVRPRSDGKSDTNYKNFCFQDSGEKHLTSWMKSNLECLVLPFKGNLKNQENQLISEYIPPLNLTNNCNNYYKEQISELRKLCREEAKKEWESKYSGKF